MDRWFGVDYDNTLIDKNGHPIPEMVEKVNKALYERKDVRIFTARATNDSACDEVRTFCREYLGKELPITNEKDYKMEELWDDRSYNPILDNHMLKGLGGLAATLKERFAGQDNKKKKSGLAGAVSRLRQRQQGRVKRDRPMEALDKYNA